MEKALSSARIALLYEDEAAHISYMVLTLSKDGTLSEVNGNNIGFSKYVSFFREFLNMIKSFMIRLQQKFKPL